jgi:hypothetical protein
MEVPAEVLVHNQLVGFKGNAGTLLRISEHGYYEINIVFGGQRAHRVMLPIHSTVLISKEPVTEVEADFEIER